MGEECVFICGFDKKYPFKCVVLGKLTFGRMNYPLSDNM